MTFLQAGSSATDTGIHITMGGAVVALIVEKLWDKMRNGKGKTCRYDERVLTDIRDGIRELVTIVRMKRDL